MIPKHIELSNQSLIEFIEEAFKRQDFDIIQSSVTELIRRFRSEVICIE